VEINDFAINGVQI